MKFGTFGPSKLVASATSTPTTPTTPSVAYSVAGAVHDVLGYVGPAFGAPHDGMNFSTWDKNQDLSPMNICAIYFGGGWWWHQCSVWCPTSNNPVWFSLGDSGWYLMERVHMMIKPQ